MTLANGASRAIYAISRSKVFARGVAFTKFDLKIQGSVIWAIDARVEVLDCDFTENVVSDTAVIRAEFSCTPYSSAADDEDVHVLSIAGSRFERNAAATSFGVRSYI
jgi:hypothetical protein